MPRVHAEGRRTAAEHAAFIAFHRKVLAGTDDEGLRAFLAFLDGWEPQRFRAAEWSEAMLDGTSSSCWSRSGGSA
jgi:CRISPR-associated protein Csd1